MVDDVGRPLLEVLDLVTHFPRRVGLFGTRREVVQAVNGVSLHVAARETLGLVGESGCGKTTLRRTMLRLVDRTAGEVRFDGQDVFALAPRGAAASAAADADHLPGPVRRR